jgi:hypothetical protein
MITTMGKKADSDTLLHFVFALACTVAVYAVIGVFGLPAFCEWVTNGSDTEFTPMGISLTWGCIAGLVCWLLLAAQRLVTIGNVDKENWRLRDMFGVTGTLGVLVGNNAAVLWLTGWWAILLVPLSMTIAVVLAAILFIFFAMMEEVRIPKR